MNNDDLPTLLGGFFNVHYDILLRLQGRPTPQPPHETGAEPSDAWPLLFALGRFVSKLPTPLRIQLLRYTKYPQNTSDEHLVEEALGIIRRAMDDEFGRSAWGTGGHQSSSP